MPATIQRGAQGQEVQQLQYLLVRTKILGGPSDIDGIFGPRTEEAVKAFQSDNGLTADGIVGPKTWAKLLSEHEIPPVLAEGSSGPAVSKLQQALNTGRGEWDPTAAALAVDGQFGPLTRQMVVAFQRFAGATPDGVVGYRTWDSPIGALGGVLASLAGV